MKKTIILLAFTTSVLASCNQGTDNSKSTTQTAKVDSNSQSGDNHSYHEKVMISVDTANAWIQNYHKSLKAAKKPIENVSFMLNADVLRRYLNKDTSLHMLDVYLAEKNPGEISLIYIGASQVDTDGKEMWVEKPIISPETNISYVFDHGIPCPVCTDRIGIHTPPSKTSATLDAGMEKKK